MLATLEHEKEEEGDRDKCYDDNYDNDSDIPPIVKFASIDRMEVRGINSYIGKVFIPAMAGDTVNKVNGLIEDD